MKYDLVYVYTESSPDEIREALRDELGGKIVEGVSGSLFLHFGYPRCSASIDEMLDREPGDPEVLIVLNYRDPEDRSKEDERQQALAFELFEALEKAIPDRIELHAADDTLIRERPAIGTSQQRRVAPPHPYRGPRAKYSRAFVVSDQLSKIDSSSWLTIKFTLPKVRSSKEISKALAVPANVPQRSPPSEASQDQSRVWSPRTSAVTLALSVLPGSTSMLTSRNIRSPDWPDIGGAVDVKQLIFDSLLLVIVTIRSLPSVVAESVTSSGAAWAGAANTAARSGAASSADAAVRTDFFTGFPFGPVMFRDANPSLHPWARTTLRSRGEPFPSPVLPRGPG